MSRHPNEVLLSGYVRGQIDQATSMALEMHLATCASCRTSLAQFVDAEPLQRGWEAIRDAISAPRQGALETLLVKAGMADTTARLVAATPSLRTSWLVAVSVALGFAVVAAYQGTNGLLVFLVVAPLLPVAGVASAYGPGVDPTYEIGLAAPLNSFRLLLLRAAAVLTATTVLAGMAGLLLPGPHWTAAAWLLPALGLTLGSLALSTVIEPLHAARFIGLGWLVAVATITVPAQDKLALFNPRGQIVFALLAVVGWVTLVWRRAVFEQGRTR
jgi:hypothetical protein